MQLSATVYTRFCEGCVSSTNVITATRHRPTIISGPPAPWSMPNAAPVFSTCVRRISSQPAGHVSPSSRRARTSAFVHWSTPITTAAMERNVAMRRQMRGGADVGDELGGGLIGEVMVHPS